MSIFAMMRENSFKRFATAIPATSATDGKKESGTVAEIATVAVATPKPEKAEHGETSLSVAIIADIAVADCQSENSTIEDFAQALAKELGTTTELQRERADDIAKYAAERAAIMEFDGGLSRPEAEREALRLTAIKFAITAC